jgi:hypothetical protein
MEVVKKYNQLIHNDIFLQLIHNDICLPVQLVISLMFLALLSLFVPVRTVANRPKVLPLSKVVIKLLGDFDERMPDRCPMSMVRKSTVR